MKQMEQLEQIKRSCALPFQNRFPKILTFILLNKWNKGTNEEILHFKKYIIINFAEQMEQMEQLEQIKRSCN